MQKIVGIGDMALSNQIEDKIKTFALASCVGIVVYSPIKKVGGLIHIALPKPQNERVSLNRYCYYASTGIPHFINTICKNYGCVKGELEITIYGGANSIRNNDTFNVGRKNLEAVKYILNEMDLNFNDNDTGNTVSRTIELDIATGRISVSYQQIII